MEKINPDNYSVIMSVITKEYVDTNNFEDVENFYRQMLKKPLHYENKLMIVIDGYDDDDRELFEIQEIRDYFFTLDKLFPYWFYFLKRDVEQIHSPLKLIAMLLVPCKIVANNSAKNTIEYDIDKFNTFMENHFHYLNELTDKLSLPLKENRRISLEVIDCFK